MVVFDGGVFGNEECMELFVVWVGNPLLRPSIRLNRKRIEISRVSHRIPSPGYTKTIKIVNDFVNQLDIPQKRNRPNPLPGLI